MHIYIYIYIYMYILQSVAIMAQDSSSEPEVLVSLKSNAVASADAAPDDVVVPPRAKRARLTQPLEQEGPPCIVALCGSGHGSWADNLVGRGGHECVSLLHRCLDNLDIDGLDFSTDVSGGPCSLFGFVVMKAHSFYVAHDVAATPAKKFALPFVEVAKKGRRVAENKIGIFKLPILAAAFLPRAVLITEDVAAMRPEDASAMLLGLAAGFVKHH
jgi:hypothetical protein